MPAINRSLGYVDHSRVLTYTALAAYGAIAWVEGSPTQ